MFAAEKGLEIENVKVDIHAGENRCQPFLSLNSTGTTPVLVLESGFAISETIAICDYLDGVHPGRTSLMGATPHERAESLMWWRRVDLQVVQPMTAGFRAAEGLDMFRDRVRCIPTAADEFKLMAQEGFAWIDGQLKDRDYLADDRLTVGDLLLFCFTEFGSLVGQAPDSELTNIQAWLARMKTRPSAAVSWLE
jgi:glutathione S-transferase